MAFDALLLEQCQSEKNRGPVLRFYLWEGAWLSLGRHQTPRSNHWLSLVRNGSLKMVRRPSGGGAVLHGGGLTYALIWPDPPRQRREAYRRVNAWISSGLARLGLGLQLHHVHAEKVHLPSEAHPHLDPNLDHSPAASMRVTRS